MALRLRTRAQVSEEYQMPLRSVDSRMVELGVKPFNPPTKGRGHRVLYDTNEIDIALQNERERQLAKKEKRSASIRRQPPKGANIFEMSWSQAKEFLTPQSPTQ